jgi:4-hydroxybenzoate polyprenyltransferase
VPESRPDRCAQYSAKHYGLAYNCRRLSVLFQKRWSQHPYVRHLRLNFNVLLSPIYFWGVLLAGGTLRSVDFWLAYVTLHIFLYGGTTAFNSYYDKDEGPIGGMLKPPQVDRGLLGFSLIVQGLGLLLALLVNWAFVLAWLLLFIVASAYSHPLVRLKAQPLLALLAVAIGQGAIGFAAGWLVVSPDWATLFTLPGHLGMLSTALIVSGLYIITQSYQTKEDRARGDKTVPVLFGAARALWLATLILALGGGLLLWTVAQTFTLVWTLVLGFSFALTGINLLLWANSFDENAVISNFRRAMWTTAVSSSVLSLFLLVHLWR